MADKTYKVYMDAEDAIDLIRDERYYQETTDGKDEARTPLDFAVLITHYAAIAKMIIENSTNEPTDALMQNFRKIGAIAVAAIQHNGAPKRL